jgi:hypothetical protein
MGLVEHLEKRWKEMEIQIRSITQTPLDPKLITLGPEDEVNSDDEFEKIANNPTVVPTSIPKTVLPTILSATTSNEPDFKSPRKMSSDVGVPHVGSKGSKEDEHSLKTTTPTGSLRGSTNLSDSVGSGDEPIERHHSMTVSSSKKRLSIGNAIKGDRNSNPNVFAPGTPQPGSKEEDRKPIHKKSILGIFKKE